MSRRKLPGLDPTMFHGPAPSPQPEMPEGLQLTEDEQDWFLCNGYGSKAGPNQVKHLIDQLRVIAPLLSRAGLTIVGPAERAVLEACEALEEYDLKYWVVRPKSGGKRANLAEAELARRAAKEGT